MAKRRGRYGGWLTAGVVITAFGVLLLIVGLEKADMFSSVLAAIAGVIGLLISLSDVRRGRNAQAGSSDDSVAQAAPMSSSGIRMRGAASVGGRSIRLVREHCRSTIGHVCHTAPRRPCPRIGRAVQDR